LRCGLVDDISVDTSNDNVFESWYSLVAGAGAPIIRATGAAGTIAMRHGSGGIEFATLSASHNVSVETDGQVIFNADCNVNANVSLRGNMTITDNTAGMNSLNQDAAINMSKINAEVLDVMNVDTFAEPGQGAPAATTSIFAKINYIYKAWRNKKDNDGTTRNLYADDASTVDQKSGVGEAAGTVTTDEWESGP
jgi:hypothetical protein